MLLACMDEKVEDVVNLCIGRMTRLDAGRLGYVIVREGSQLGTHLLFINFLPCPNCGKMREHLRIEFVLHLVLSADETKPPTPLYI